MDFTGTDLLPIILSMFCILSFIIECSERAVRVRGDNVIECDNDPFTRAKNALDRCQVVHA